MNFAELVGTVVHDLKNQLQSLLDYEHEALSQIPSQYHVHIFPILQRTLRLKNDTMKMVSLFRMEQKQNLISDDAWPLDTANGAIEVTQIQFPNLNIENHIAADSQGFYNDNLVMLALVTLITNSAQAGSTKIVLTAQDQDGLMLKIEDNGHGFPESILKGEKATTKAEGSGLGLHFVRLIAEHHQQGNKKGHIELGNLTQNAGAFVCLYLP
ncbi:MAG: hypothetical protein RL217_348 [Pseudomonadota bacterium]|jgi:signal transduction histidine kinase